MSSPTCSDVQQALLNNLFIQFNLEKHAPIISTCIGFTEFSRALLGSDFLEQ